MKKLILALIIFTLPYQGYAKRICLDVSDTDYDAVETMVEDPVEWLRWDWIGKAQKAKSLIQQDELKHREEKQMPLPSSTDLLIKEGIKRVGTRKERDKREAEERKRLEPVPTPTPTP